MRTVVALYDRFEDAQRAVEALNEQGFNREDMNLLASDEHGEYSRGLETTTTDADASGGEGAATGAGIGAVLGGLGGLLVGLGALAIPGVGPVIAAGPIVAALAGAGVGAVAGGLIGALVDLGIPEEHANYYAEGIRRGGTLVTVRAEDHLAEDARMVLNRFNPTDIDTRAREWQGEGWKGFNEGDFGQTESTLQSTSGVPVTGSDMRQDDPFRGVGSDLNTTENVHGTSIGDNYPRTNLDKDMDPDLSRREFTDRDRDLGDRDLISGTDEITRMDDHLRDDVFGKDRPGTGDLDVPVTGSDMRQDDPFRGVGSDLNTTENVHGTSIGDNYPRTNVYDEMDLTASDRDLNDRDRDFSDRGNISGSDEVTRMDDHLRDDVFGNDRPGTGDLDVPVTGGTSGMVDNRMSGYGSLETDTDWSMYDQSFRSDYQTRYAMSGYDFDYYSPAYRYGYDLAHEDTYRGYDWERIEPEARRDWESRGLEGTWDDMKDAVRHAWESITR